MQASVVFWSKSHDAKQKHANETDEMIVCHVKLNNMFGYFMIVCLTYMLDIAFDWSQNVQSNGPP